LVDNRKTLTLETSLTSAEEVEERQPEWDVNVDTPWYNYSHARDANIDEDSNRDPSVGEWEEGGEMCRTGRKLSIAAVRQKQYHLLWVDRGKNTSSKATGALRQ
jgi:hypothetical protein